MKDCSSSIARKLQSLIGSSRKSHESNADNDLFSRMLATVKKEERSEVPTSLTASFSAQRVNNNVQGQNIVTTSRANAAPTVEKLNAVPLSTPYTGLPVYIDNRSNNTVFKERNSIVRAKYSLQVN
jgi:hypothetical protein